MAIYNLYTCSVANAGLSRFYVFTHVLAIATAIYLCVGIFSYAVGFVSQPIALAIFV